MHRIWIVVVAIAWGLLTAVEVQAAISAGASIFNQATLNYDGGEVKASVSVGVVLVPSSPILPDPGDSGANTTSGADETITYTLIGTANGEDTYNLTDSSADTCSPVATCALGSPTVTFLEGTSGSTTISSISLEGAITSGASNASGQILIPAGSEANLTEGTVVAIETTPGSGIYYSYDVGTIVPGTVAGIDSPEVATTVVLTPTSGGPLDGGPDIGDGTGGTVLLAAGTVIGEVVEFRAVVTAGTFGGSATSGEHVVDVIVTSTTDSGVSETDDTTILVVPVEVTVVKQVANKTDSTLGPVCGSPPCFGGTGSVNAKSGHILIYKIIMSVPGTAAANVTGAFLTDDEPAFTDYQTDTLKLNDVLHSDSAGTDGGTLPLISGIDVNSSGQATGVIAVGAAAEVTFEVEVD